jgi:hypothetical protein
MINTRINQIRQTHEEISFVEIKEKDGLSIDDLIKCVKDLKESGLSYEQIKNDILPNLGYAESSLPSEILQQLK